MRSVQLAAGLAAVVLLALAGWNLLPRTTGSGGPPTPGPTVSPSPTLSPLGLRSGLSLAAGTYTAHEQAGSLTLTVPDGWLSPEVNERAFSLHRYAGPPDDTVQVFFDMRRAAKDAACTEAPQPGAGSTAAEIAADISSDANLVVDRPGPISLTGAGDLPGLEGQTLDVQLAAGAERTCPYSGGKPDVPLIVDLIPGKGDFWSIGPGERLRLVILDSYRGHNVVVAIDSAAGASFDDLVNATMPIVESFRFVPAGT